MDLKFFEEQIFFATVRITIPNTSGTGASIGTGFIYKVPITEERSCILLVSNKHVYGNSSNPIELTFHKRDPNDESRPLLGEKIVLSDKSFDSIYTEHPDPTVDLACTNISVIGNPELEIYYKNLADDLLVDFAHERLLPGSDVWFIGYPENRFDTLNNLPILRRGYIASIPKVDFQGRSELLIDAQVFQGSSGSPVFTAIGGTFKLVGVVTQTMIRNERVQAVPVSHTYAVTQTIGLGIVLKSSLLKELIDKATDEIRTRIRQEKPEPTQPKEEGEQVG